MDKIFSGGAKRLLSLSHFNNQMAGFFFLDGIIDVVQLQLEPLHSKWVPRSS